MSTKQQNIFIAVALVAVFLVFAAWIVSTRTGGIETHGEMPLELPLGQPVEMGTEKTFTPPVGGSSGLPVLSSGMPEFEGIEAWLNSEPLTQEELRGKVVLIDFWTYSCINCIRTLPFVTSWYDKYEKDGFVIIGVHTPEFAFEKVRKNVEKAIKRHGINFPVAQDNDFETWNNYNNRYWPAKYLFDHNGKLRYTHFGEGQYDVTEKNIQALLREAGEDIDEEISDMTSDVDFRRIGTPETYLGYWRMDHNGNPEALLRDTAQDYTVPAPTKFNNFYFDGNWEIKRQHSVLNEAGGALIYRYRAATVNLVMGAPEGETVRARVFIDGANKGEIEVTEETLYELFSTPGDYREHELRLEFLDPGVEVYAFTFG